LVIASTGRDEDRLKKLAAEMRAPVTFLGRVPHDDLPALYGCADVFSMMCRNRWGGLEQEGFGIVFVEAAACGVPQIAGDSGGAAEAVLDGVTGFVMANPDDSSGLAARIVDILDKPELRASMVVASRERALSEFNYDVLASRLGDVLKVGQ
jgi:phosphatidylinositol alpha-1,6-mannosyltransferase